jgi:hypothetical protein
MPGHGIKKPSILLMAIKLLISKLQSEIKFVKFDDMFRIILNTLIPSKIKKITLNTPLKSSAGGRLF